MEEYIADNPRRRWRRRLIALVLLCVAVAGFVGWSYWRGSSELRAAMAEAERTDPNWRLADYEAHRAVVPDTENSAWVIQAGKKLVGAKPSNEIALDVLLGANDHLNHRLNEEEKNALIQLLPPYRTAFGEWDKLKALPSGREPITYAPSIFAMNPVLIQRVQVVREVSVALRYRCHERLEANDVIGAADDVLRMFNNARSFGDEPFFSSMQFRIATYWLAVGACERTLAMGELDEPTLATLQAAVELELSEPLLERSMRGERGSMFEAIEYLKSSGTVSSATGLGGWEPYIMRIPGMIEHNQAAVLRCMNAGVEQAQKPVHEQAKLFAESDRNFARLPWKSRDEKPGLFGMAVFHRHQAQLRCLQVALAAERYRRTKGRWPMQLDELVAGKLISAVPIDPFDGKLLRWKLVPEGTIVYSVGRDGVDNDGDVGLKPNAPPADLGLRLFNVDQRNLPPLPPKPKEEPPPEMP